MANYNPDRLREIEEQSQKLAIERQLYLQKALTSGNVDDIFKAQQYLSKLGKPTSQPIIGSHKSIVIDPFEIASSMGYYQKTSQVSYEILRAMAKTPVINAIIMTRKDQVADFCVPQPDKYSTGFVFKKRGIQKEQDLSDRDKREIDKLTEFIINCAENEAIFDLDDFDAFIRKIVDDSLVLDQGCAEIVFNKFGEPIQYLPVDGSTIRIADSYDNVNNIKEGDKKINGYYPSYVQIYQNVIVNEYYPWELCFGVRNPSSAIMANGYGKSELEILISTVSSMLNADAFNAKNFRNGTAPKGALMVKNQGGLNRDKIAELRREWTAMMAGVDNCLHPDTLIWTKEYGGLEIENVLRGEKEKNITIWTGKKWENARAFATSQKKTVSNTKLNNGITVKTSQDHKFAIINERGEFDWKTQRDLQIGDCVLVNKNSIDGDENNIPSYDGKLLTEEIFEILGWMTGDGSLFYQDWSRLDREQRGVLMLFFHPSKEIPILDRYFDILVKFGLNPIKHQINLSDEKREKIKIERGFKTVSDVQYNISLHNKKFVKFLLDIGFQTSTEKKVIPEIIFNLPDSYKGAFLRGFFSADGCLEHYDTPSIAIHNNNLRNQTRNLLLSLGIRTICTDSSKSPQFNLGKLRIAKFLRLRDKQIFFDKIGFIQNHKQPKFKHGHRLSNSFPKQVIKDFLPLLRKAHKESEYKLTQGQYNDLKSALRGDEDFSFDRMIRYAKQLHVSYPKFWDEYYFEKVVSISHTNELIQMYDVEVFDDNHAFVAEGAIVHNSHKTPILDAEKVEWVDLYKSNRDMEFSKYQEYLIKVACACYKISPEEIGFPLQGYEGNGLGSKEGGEQEKVFSREKGLKPLLKSIQTWINKFIVYPKTQGKYEFVFAGMGVESSAEEEERLIKATASYMEVNEVRAIKGLEPLAYGDMILNPIAMQAQQMQQGQQQGMNPFLPQQQEQEEEEESPMEKALQDFWTKEMATA